MSVRRGDEDFEYERRQSLIEEDQADHAEPTRYLALTVPLTTRTRRGKTHLVVENYGAAVYTACGRTVNSKSVYAEPVESATCGNCRRIEESK